MIRKGDVVRFKPQWQDPGDENIRYVAVEDEDGGRVRVMADLGQTVNPTQVVDCDMISSLVPFASSQC